MNSDLKRPVRQIVEMLVRHDYANIVTLTGGRRLTLENIRDSISNYGRKLSLPPLEAYDRIDAIQIDGRNPPAWSVRMQLWTNDDGPSDLSIELTLTRSDDGFEFELDDIHVL